MSIFVIYGPLIVGIVFALLLTFWRPRIAIWVGLILLFAGNFGQVAACKGLEIRTSHWIQDAWGFSPTQNQKKVTKKVNAIPANGIACA